jgi:hypothetical protein
LEILSSVLSEAYNNSNVSSKISTEDDRANQQHGGNVSNHGGGGGVGGVGIGGGSVDVFASADFWDSLAACLDMFVLLDTLKNVKGAMNNDFSMFKRTIPNLPPNSGMQDQTALYHKLYFFLGTQDHVLGKLKKGLKDRLGVGNIGTAGGKNGGEERDGYDDLVADFIGYLGEKLEDIESSSNGGGGGGGGGPGGLVLPERRYMYLRVRFDPFSSLYIAESKCRFIESHLNLLLF